MRPGVEPHESPKPSAMWTHDLRAHLQARYAEFLIVYPLPTPFLFPPLVDWDGGRAWVKINHGSSPLSLLLILFSLLGIGGLFCSLQVISGLVVFSMVASLACKWEEVLICCLTLSSFHHPLSSAHFLI